MNGQFNRRSFCRAACALGLVQFWHPYRCFAAEEKKAKPHDKSKPATPRFRQLRLQTADLNRIDQFYGDTLGIPVHARQASTISFAFGQTLIEFEQAVAGEQPFYHFAFNIPHKKFKRAKEWLADRCPLLKDSRTGADELYFENWDAHAVYFQDPSGNIGELIARHTLDNSSDGPFSVSDILCASEIGIVSPEPDQIVAELERSFGLKAYLDNPMFVGDEAGLFVLPPVGRLWIPERRQKAAVFPVDVELAVGGPATYRAPNLPYVIRGAS
jgi:hypothetical protein